MKCFKHYIEIYLILKLASQKEENIKKTDRYIKVLNLLSHRGS